MLVFPFPSPEKVEPTRGTFAVVYSANGLHVKPATFVQRPARPPERVAFYPSPYSLAWGAEAAPVAPAAPAAAMSYLSQFQSYLPAVAQAASAYTESNDPRVQVKVYEQKIKNYQKMKTTPPYNLVPGVLWYDNEIAKLKAKLAAAKEKLTLSQEGEKSARQWRSLGQTAVGVSIVAGIAIVTLLAVTAARVARR